MYERIDIIYARGSMSHVRWGLCHMCEGVYITCAMGSMSYVRGDLCHVYGEVVRNADDKRLTESQLLEMLGLESIQSLLPTWMPTSLYP